MKIRIEGLHRDWLRSPDGVLIQHTPPAHNRVVMRALDLIAGLFVNDPQLRGLRFLAVGKGRVEWDNQLPVPALESRRLAAEVYRHPLDAASFSYDLGTRRLTIRTTIPAGAATGTLREFGIFGGDASELPDTGYLFSYRIHPRIDLAADTTLEREIVIDLAGAGWLNTAADTVADLLAQRGGSAGIQYWAEGEGDPAWDVTPPAPNPARASLAREIYRKPLVPVRDLSYDSSTLQIFVRTRIGYAEAVGQLREVGVFGGTDGKQLLIYQTFPVLNKTSLLDVDRVLRFALTGDRTVAVPELQDLQRAQALERLAAAELLAEPVQEIEAPPPFGRILRTEPPAGTVVPVGSRVAIDVAVAPLVIVPSVIGQPLEAAQAALENVGLTTEELMEESTGLPGMVLRQRPAAWEKTRAGSVVELVLALPPLVEVPDLTGLDESRVQLVLEKAGLKAALPLMQESSVTAGTVIEQEPLAGTKSAFGASVSFTVATLHTLPVPDLTLKTIVEAEEILHATGIQMLRDLNLDTSLPALSLGQIKETESTMTAGMILDQAPAAGSRVPLYRMVDVSIAVPASVIVPDLVGVSQEAAVKRIADLRLAQGRVVGRQSASPANTVVAQTPGAGTVVLANTPVDLTIAVPLTVEVPRLIGMSVEAAAEVVKSRGLVLGKPTLGQGTEPEGTVIGQQPAPGTKVELGTSIQPVVTGTSEVPDLIGLQLSEAEEQAKTAGLSVTVATLTRSNRPVGSILTQQPAAGERLAFGSAVTVTQAEGVETPNLIGMLSTQIGSILTSLQLGFRVADRIPSEKPPNTILEQKPVAGVIVPTETEIQAVVAEGVSVPNIIGLPQEQAAETLKEMKLRFRVTDSTGSDQPKGTVIRQNPTAGQVVPLETEVTAVISEGRSIQVPRLIGLTVDQAKATAANAGLVMRVGSEQAGGFPRGTVMAQDPAAGQQTSTGAVVVTVSTGELTTDEVIVPDLFGLTVSQARLALEAMRLKIRTSLPSTARIRKQAPQAGDVVPPGTSITVS